MPNLMIAGRFGAVQVVSVELAAMALAAAAFALPLPLAIAAAPVVILLVLVGVARSGGRWWYEILATWLRLRQRQRLGARTVRRGAPAGPYAAELVTLAPRLNVHESQYKNVSIGIGADEWGWFGAIAVAPHDGLTAGAGVVLRLDRLARLVGEPSSSASAVQVVLRETPMPSALIDAGSRCARSYQELRDGLTVPAHRDVWLAVRLGLNDGGVVAADHGNDIAVINRSLGTALSRVSSLLTSAGLDHRVLNAVELQQALAGAYGPNPYDGRLAGSTSKAHETWSQWRTGRTVHVCYAVSGWPRQPSADLLAELAQVPGAVSVCTGIVLGEVRTPGRGHGPVGARTVLRVVAAPSAVGTCLRHVRASARRLGVRLVRLDGEQAAGVYATTPTAAPIGPSLW